MEVMNKDNMNITDSNLAMIAKHEFAKDFAKAMKMESPIMGRSISPLLLFSLKEFKVTTPESLYEFVRRINEFRCLRNLIIDIDPTIHSYDDRYRVDSLILPGTLQKLYIGHTDLLNIDAAKSKVSHMVLMSNEKLKKIKGLSEQIKILAIGNCPELRANYKNVLKTATVIADVVQTRYRPDIDDVITDSRMHVSEVMSHNAFFRVPKETYLQMIREADKILSAITDDSMSQLEKAIRINAYMCAHLKYKKNNLHDFSIVGAMLNRKGVCQAFSKMEIFLLNRAGIDAKMVLCAPVLQKELSPLESIFGASVRNGQNFTHAIVRIDIDNRSYYCDPANSLSTPEKASEGISFLSRAAFGRISYDGKFYAMDVSEDEISGDSVPKEVIQSVSKGIDQIIVPAEHTDYGQALYMVQAEELLQYDITDEDILFVESQAAIDVGGDATKIADKIDEREERGSL